MAAQQQDPIEFLAKLAKLPPQVRAAPTPRARRAGRALLQVPSTATGTHPQHPVGAICRFRQWFRNSSFSVPGLRPASSLKLARAHKLAHLCLPPHAHPEVDQCQLLVRTRALLVFVRGDQRRAQSARVPSVPAHCGGCTAWLAQSTTEPPTPPAHAQRSRNRCVRPWARPAQRSRRRPR